MRQLILILFFLSGASLACAAPSDYPFFTPDFIFQEDRSGLPGGDYQNKCRNCQIDNDGLLVCDCPVKREKRPTRYFVRSLDTDSCTRWAVKLVKTHLVCDEQYATEAAPKVDYSEDTPPLLETSEDLPLGDYRYYCTQCTISNQGQLSCSCKIPGLIYDSWYKASLALGSCSSLENIAYANGQLYCDNKEMLNAIGDFTKSCRNCTILGDNLYCLCDKTQCDWSTKDVDKGRNRQRAVLPNFRNCNTRIINCNGYLRCGSCGFTDFWDESRRPREGRSSMKSCDTFYLPF